MGEIETAIAFATTKFHEEFGVDAKLEEDGKLKTDFIGGKPYKVDMTLSAFE